jgi:hypothetical protein
MSFNGMMLVMPGREVNQSLIVRLRRGDGFPAEVASIHCLDGLRFGPVTWKSRTEQMRPTTTAVAWQLFLLIIVSYGYFFSSVNANTRSRVALALAIVERHELTIDFLAPLTADEAFVNGSYYSGKAPGLSLLAVPVTLIAAKIINPGGDPGAWLTPARGLSRKFSMINLSFDAFHRPSPCSRPLPS